MINKKYVRFTGILCALLSVAISFSSCFEGASQSVTQSEKVFTPLNNKSLVEENWKDTGNQFSASKQENDALADMELMLQNDKLELYLGKTYFDIAVKDKSTEHIWFSNPAIAHKDPKADMTKESIAIAYSQLAISYYDQQNVLHQMFSTPDATDGKERKQVIASVTDNTLNMTYTIGIDDSGLIICNVLAESTFDTLMQKGNRLAQDGTLQYSTLGMFENSYSKIEYNSLSDDDKKIYTKKYPDLQKLGVIYELASELNDLQKGRIQDFFKAMGWTSAEVQAEEGKFASGSNVQSNSVCFKIPLSYRLQGGDFIVSVDTENVVNSNGSYLDKVWVLPAFGGAKEGQGGYMFIPDGSGAIVENDNAKSDQLSISLPFYGSDISKSLDNAKDLDNASPFPVFGIREKDYGFFAVVESGDAIGGFTANVSDINSSYNRVCSWYNFIPNDTMLLDQKSNGADQKVFSAKSVNTEFRVRYHFLYGEKSNYSGMAEYYRKYLEQTGVLTRLNPNEDAILNLDLLGCVNKTKQVFGFPARVLQPLTTFAQTGDILQQLYDGGVKQVDVQYEGWMNGGLEYRLTNKVEIEDILGGNKEFEKLSKKASRLGFGFYPMADFSKVYAKGNGFNTNDYSARSLDKNISFVAGYSSSTGKKLHDNMGLVISAGRYPIIINSFLKSIKKLGQNSITVASFSSMLGSDFNDKNIINREASKQNTVNALNSLLKHNLKIKSDGANAYTLEFSDNFTNVPLYSSEKRIEYSSVPFVAMVLHGYKKIFSAPLNTEPNYQIALLRAAENGVGLNYKLIGESNAVLSNTSINSAFSISKNEWLDEITQQCKKYQNEFDGLTDKAIINHRMLQSDVYETTFENGVKVIVNYSDKQVQTGNVIIKALDYAVLR